MGFMLPSYFDSFMSQSGKEIIIEFKRGQRGLMVMEHGWGSEGHGFELGQNFCQSLTQDCLSSRMKSINRWSQLVMAVQVKKFFPWSGQFFVAQIGSGQPSLVWVWKNFP